MSLNFGDLLSFVSFLNYIYVFVHTAIFSIDTLTKIAPEMQNTDNEIVLSLVNELWDIFERYDFQSTLGCL